MYGELVPTGGGDNIPLMKDELIVGRHENCDIVLRFSNVSSRHCRLVLSSGYWYVQDMQSTNGVKVNGVKVLDRRIDPGARVTISKHEYRLQYNPLKLGAAGAVPPDVLEHDIFSKSLLESAGLQKMAASQKRLDEQREKRQSTQHRQIVFNYDDLTIDDIKFE